MKSRTKAKAPDSSTFLALPVFPQISFKFLLLIPISFLGYHTYSHPILFALTPFMLTPALIKTITWQSRLAIFSYAFGASILCVKPIGDVLGDNSTLEQITACLLLATISALPWLAISGTGRIRLATSIVACLIAILPPIGTIAAPNPYMSAGYLFPGTGITGLALTASIIILPYNLKGNFRILFFCAIFSVSGLTNLLHSSTNLPDQWVGLETGFSESNANQISERYTRSRELISQITDELDNGKKVIVAPESVLGLRSPSLGPQLNLISARAKRNDAVILVGLIEKANGQFENTLLILGKKESQYNARQPVPFVMWNLWQGDNFNTHWWDSRVFSVSGKRAAILICWEEWVMWPMLLSSLEKPDIIISASNHGWANEGRHMWEKQTVSAKAIGRLYGLPMIRAVNLPQI